MMPTKRWIFALQVASVIYIWIFVLTVAVWIINLIFVAHRLNDAFDASVAISIVTIPVFLILAGVLTYVFVGLRRGTRGQHEDEFDRQQRNNSLR